MPMSRTCCRSLALVSDHKKIHLRWILLPDVNDNKACLTTCNCFTRESQKKRQKPQQIPLIVCHYPDSIFFYILFSKMSWNSNLFSLKKKQQTCSLSLWQSSYTCTLYTTRYDSNNQFLILTCLSPILLTRHVKSTKHLFNHLLVIRLNVFTIML